MRVKGVPSLRHQTLYEVVRKCLERASRRGGFRICHYSILDDHAHLIVEAPHRSALSRGVQGLTIRLAKALNRHLGRRGKVFADRFHSRPLRTPTQTRRALNYVLNNCHKHIHPTDYGHAYHRRWVDPCSSALAFDGWSCEPHCPDARPPPVDPPRTWLLRTGWRRSKLGLVEPWTLPGRSPVRISRRAAPC
jgi:REP element-mobilizing transposase RayT